MLRKNTNPESKKRDPALVFCYEAYDPYSICVAPLARAHAHHIVRSNVKMTEHRGAPLPAMHSTVQAKRLAPSLHSRAPV